MSEWKDTQRKLNTQLLDLLKRGETKIRKLSELSKTEQNRLATLNARLETFRLWKNVQNHQLAIWLTEDGYESRNSQNSFTQQHDDLPFS
jgi:hypothetical protein